MKRGWLYPRARQAGEASCCGQNWPLIGDFAFVPGPWSKRGNRAPGVFDAEFPLVILCMLRRDEGWKESIIYWFVIFRGNRIHSI
jgi:hypothetical protein